ncbi:hypothetical protein RRG08_060094 [Elysia crispata]|uniref:Uncharacterized protein n=1 Tax=Elysia crispata TaxID=231223 RepID=A0AAE0Y3K6_9GAST|nr:hypothetical protein RRG08_060094 [Elysia crispata]
MMSREERKKDFVVHTDGVPDHQPYEMFISQMNQGSAMLIEWLCVKRYQPLPEERLKSSVSDRGSSSKPLNGPQRSAAGCRDRASVLISAGTFYVGSSPTTAVLQTPALSQREEHHRPLVSRGLLCSAIHAAFWVDLQVRPLGSYLDVLKIELCTRSAPEGEIGRLKRFELCTGSVHEGEIVRQIGKTGLSCVFT